MRRLLRPYVALTLLCLALAGVASLDGCEAPRIPDATPLLGAAVTWEDPPDMATRAAIRSAIDATAAVYRRDYGALPLVLSVRFERGASIRPALLEQLHAGASRRGVRGLCGIRWDAERGRLGARIWLSESWPWPTRWLLHELHHAGLWLLTGSVDPLHGHPSWPRVRVAGPNLARRLWWGW